MKREVEYYDIPLDRNFTLLALDGGVTEKELMIDYKDDIHRAIFKALEYVLSNSELDRVPCFLINEHVFDICVEDYHEHASTCLKYFSSIEEYEKCAVLVDFGKKVLNQTLDDLDINGL
jgi:hypothetical protein